MNSAHETHASDNIVLRDLRELSLYRRLITCHRFYKCIYLPNFPDSELREGPLSWLLLMMFNKPPSPLPLNHIILAFDNRDSYKIVGGIIVEYYLKTGVALATYLVVDTDHRRRGVGKRLLAYARQVLAADAKKFGNANPLLIAEAEDPRRIIDQDESDKAKIRLKILSHLGFFGSDLPYVQPPLRPGKPYVDRLLLLVQVSETDTKTIPAPIFYDFLYEFYRALGKRKPLLVPQFTAMAQWLEQHNPVPLSPLETIL